MTPKNDLTPEASDREIVLSRVFDAPRELVFQAFTDPQQVGSWWGPTGFTTTIHEMDVRPGGVWRYIMHGPDGTDYKNKIAYHEVVRPERLAYSHSGDYGDGGEEREGFEVTVTFEEQDGKTRLTMRSLFPTAEARNLVVEKFGAIEGGKQTLERLRQHLAAMPAAGGQAFVMSRVFDAPRELVFRAWSEAEHLAHWWGPKGCVIGVRSLDFRPGGVFHYSMQTPDGGQMWGKFVYREIVAPERIVFINSFSDEAGGTVKAPFDMDFPLETHSTLTFEEQGDKTKLTLRGIPHHATESQRETFEGMFASMNQGWTGTLDQLADYLAKA